MIWTDLAFAGILVLSLAGFFRDLYPYGLTASISVVGPLITGAAVALIRSLVIGIKGEPLLNGISLLLGSLLIATVGHPTRIVERRILDGLPSAKMVEPAEIGYSTTKSQFTFIGIFLAGFFVLSFAFPHEF